MECSSEHNYDLDPEYQELEEFIKILSDIPELNPEYQELEEFIKILSDIPELNPGSSILDIHNKVIPTSTRIIRYNDNKFPCSLCNENKHVLDLDIYYDMKIPDKNIKLCLLCAQRVYIEKLYRVSTIFMTNSRVKIFSYAGTSINTSSKEPVCIIPAKIGVNIKYVCVYYSLIRSIINPKNNRCLHCNTGNSKRKTMLYDTSYHICYVCNYICREVKFIGQNYNIFIDYHRPDMRCCIHTNNKMWVYIKLKIKHDIDIVIPICFYCYVLLDIMSSSVFL